MTPLTTLRVSLPCPACGVVGPLTLAVRTPSPASELVEAGASRGLPGGSHAGVLSDCGSCWSRRADSIATARQTLQARGEFTSLGPGQEDAWLGVPLSRSEEDFENAFASALMKAPRHLPLPAAPRVEELEIEALRRRAAKRSEELVEV